jgi:hypothetical protein
MERVLRPFAGGSVVVRSLDAEFIGGLQRRAFA